MLTSLALPFSLPFALTVVAAERGHAGLATIALPALQAADWVDHCEDRYVQEQRASQRSITDISET